MTKLLPVVSGLILSLLTVSAFSNPYNPYQRPYYRGAAPTQQPGQQVQDPAALVHQAETSLKQFLASQQARNQKVMLTFLHKEIIPHIAFRQMMQKVAGPYLRYMSTDNLNQFESQLKESFTSSLLRNLGSFNRNTRVHIEPARYRFNREAIVSTKVYLPNTYPAQLDFRFALFNDQWKIVDVQINGASAVVFYRNHFRSQLRDYRG
ncbi:MAG: ABC transporter substrate-binding protein [Gammaproteobacteria bacterium]|nr:ABC transporter substrate-binding protein [Gammaproteobacteria bacterium]